MSHLKTKFLTLATVCALATTAASAATVSGHVRRVSATASTLWIGHHRYHVAKSLPLNKLHQGERVQLTYHVRHGQRWATAFKPITGKVATMHTMHAKKKST